MSLFEQILGYSGYFSAAKGLLSDEASPWKSTPLIN
jgi:hypothetical protein